MTPREMADHHKIALGYSPDRNCLVVYCAAVVLAPHAGQKSGTFTYNMRSEPRVRHAFPSSSSLSENRAGKRCGWRPSNSRFCCKVPVSLPVTLQASGKTLPKPRSRLARSVASSSNIAFPASTPVSPPLAACISYGSVPAKPQNRNPQLGPRLLVLDRIGQKMRGASLSLSQLSVSSSTPQRPMPSAWWQQSLEQATMQVRATQVRSRPVDCPGCRYGVIM